LLLGIVHYDVTDVYVLRYVCYTLLVVHATKEEEEKIIPPAYLV